MIHAQNIWVQSKKKNHIFNLLEQTEKKHIGECDTWVWTVAAHTVWNVVNGEFSVDAMPQS